MRRRDLLLQQMGIQQWQLRRPEVLKGEVHIAVKDNIRLIVVADPIISMKEHFIRDVLRSAQIAETDCLFVDFNQSRYLLSAQPVQFWYLGNSEKIQRASMENATSNTIWQSEDLQQLKQNSSAKRALWKQIQSTFLNEE